MFIKRLITSISIALIIFGGLWFVLFLSDASSFYELFNKLVNDEFKSQRTYAVNVNIYEVQITRDPEVNFSKSLPDDLEAVLKLYFTEYNNALGSLCVNTKDIKALSALYERESPNRDIDLLILERQVQTRKQSIIDLGFDTCNLGLRLISTNFGDDEFVEIRIEECFTAAFNGINGTEQGNETPNEITNGYSGVEHFFVLDKKSSGKWQIKRHESSSALSVYITNELKKIVEADGQSMKLINTADINQYVSQLKSVLERDTYFYPADFEIQPVASYSYDRASALAYAARYTTGERIVRNLRFPEFERNGTNFTSQCLNAGGIPANSHWDSSRKSWTNASVFFDYITSPDSWISAGVCDYYNGEPGDIIQFIDGGGHAVHSVLITDIIYDAQDNQLREYLVTANSEDLSDFPLSALGFDIMRIVKIYGHN